MICSNAAFGQRLCNAYGYLLLKGFVCEQVVSGAIDSSIGSGELNVKAVAVVTVSG